MSEMQKGEKAMISLKPKDASEKIVMDMTDERMTGEEEYPVVGSCLTQTEALQLLRGCKGLRLTADCVQKAEVVLAMQKSVPSLARLGKLVLCVGAVRVWSSDMSSAYGHDFRPPIECHAWIQSMTFQKVIVDLALPGLVLRGSRLSDEIGPFLVGRDPVLLAGVPEAWMQYSIGEMWTRDEKEGHEDSTA